MMCYQKMGTLRSYKDGCGQQQYLGRLWGLHDSHLVPKYPKCAKAGVEHGVVF